MGDQGNIIDESDVDYIEESYIDEFGNKQTRKVPKIKDESFDRMQKESMEEQKRYSTIAGHTVLKEVVEIDEFGNKTIVQKLVDEDGPKQAPNSKNLKVTTITVIDANGNEVQKSVFIDDQGNIIYENDVDYIEESYIDEYGNKRIRKVPKIKDESFNRMQKEAIEEQKRYSTIPSHKVLKEVVEYDKFGNKKIVQKLVDEDGPKQAPKSRNLRVSTITVIDSNGNKVQKSVFVDDQGNIIDENDVDYVEESYVDEFGITRQKKVPKIKNESLKRMQKDALDEQ